MSKRVIKKEITWPCTRELNQFLSSSRATASTPILHAAINHAIVFYSACYIEGILEAALKRLLRRRREVYNRIDMPEFEVRKTTNTLFKALEMDVEQRISRATGIKAYDELFSLVTETKLSRRRELQPMWEGICTLFQFRNVLAHGREISASRLSAYWLEQPWLDEFAGGYKHAEEYLKKRKLIETGFWDTESPHLFFSDEVADHFWTLAQQFISEIRTSLDPTDRAVFDEMLDDPEEPEDRNGAEQEHAADG